MNSPEYIICKWPHGWSIEPGISGLGGIPMKSVVEALKAVGGKSESALIDPGIAHHLKLCGRKDTVFAVGEASALALWTKEIEDSLSERYPDPEEAWIRGCETGLSSLAIFAALTKKPHLWDIATQHTSGETPGDSSDFKRCSKLMDKVIGWRDRLPEVAEYWSARGRQEWVSVVKIWPDLEKNTPLEISRILGETKKEGD